MKRFIGWGLIIAGAVAGGWGAICVLTGASRESITLYSGVSVNAMTGGLIGLALLTIGLVWVRD